MSPISTIVVYFEIATAIIVLLGMCIKAFCFPFNGPNPFYLQDLAENLKYFVLSFVVFGASGLYFTNRFDFDCLQGDGLTPALGKLWVSFVLALVSFIGVIIFGFLCAVPTPAWFRARKGLETDVWCDYDEP